MEYYYYERYEYEEKLNNDITNGICCTSIS